MRATFDLQQVIYLPQSKGEGGALEALSMCHNFSVYDVGNGDSIYYLSHQGLTKQGSNEIASSIYDFIRMKNHEGEIEIELVL